MWSAITPRRDAASLSSAAPAALASPRSPARYMTRIVVVMPSPSDALSENGVSAVAHALREHPLELLVRSHTHGSPPTDARDRRAERGTPSGATARRRTDRRTARGTEQATADGANGRLLRRRARRLHREVSALRLVASDELRARAAVGVDRWSPLRLRHACRQRRDAEPEHHALRHGSPP